MKAPRRATYDDLRWFRAVGPRGVFAFAVHKDKVVRCAPLGRKWLLGHTEGYAQKALARRGYEVEALGTLPELAGR